ncbi:hypothetical protein NKI56_36450 [Mesorhizobium sp. M0622]|uniref:hypothetical protein n=1 Tax=Mesorhizobium sp. M0622 TaxID=2956975 RepID=UPI00333715F4
MAKTLFKSVSQNLADTPQAAAISVLSSATQRSDLQPAELTAQTPGPSGGRHASESAVFSMDGLDGYLTALIIVVDAAREAGGRRPMEILPLVERSGSL